VKTKQETCNNRKKENNLDSKMEKSIVTEFSLSYCSTQPVSDLKTFLTYERPLHERLATAELREHSDDS
jgi:hypothetical protein